MGEILEFEPRTEETKNELCVQINALTRNAYEGRNQAELQCAKAINKYNSNEWLTFLQAKQIGLKIKKGSRSVGIFKGFAQFSETGEDRDGNVKMRSVSRPVGFARVFNLDQTEAWGN